MLYNLILKICDDNAPYVDEVVEKVKETIKDKK